MCVSATTPSDDDDHDYQDHDCEDHGDEDEEAAVEADAANQARAGMAFKSWGEKTKKTLKGYSSRFERVVDDLFSII